MRVENHEAMRAVDYEAVIAELGVFPLGGNATWVCIDSAVDSRASSSDETTFYSSWRVKFEGREFWAFVFDGRLSTKLYR